MTPSRSTRSAVAFGPGLAALASLAFWASVAFWASLAATPAAAQDKPVLTVYTYDSFVTDYGPGPVVEERFEAVCGCDLRFVAAGDGAALLGRLKLEGGNSDADIVLGLDMNLMEAARRSGLVAPHGLGAIDTNLPRSWSDAEFLPYDWGYFAFVYDETRLATPPESFEALLDAPEDVTIVIQDPRSSTPGLGLLLWVKKLYGDRAGEVWKKLEPRIVTVTKGWWEAYSAFLEGEAMMALSYTTSPAYHMVVEQDATKHAAMFSEGHYLQVEVAAALKTAGDPALAQKFLSFMLSEPFQSAIPTTNWMYPARIPLEGLPEAFATLPRPDTTLTYTAEEAPAAREEALAEWLEALGQ